jgi:hypothetical protein
MPPLSTFDNHDAHAQVWEQDHSYSTCTKKTQLAPKPKRTISFGKSVMVRQTLHINSYSDDEIQACWFGDDDLQAIKKDVRYDISMLTDGLDNEKYCRRGLEMHFRKGGRRRQQNKSAAIKAVLDEQELQWENDVYDPEYLATVYQAISSYCQTTARAIALKDRLDAML